jgi:hypothetical protein
VAAGSTDRQIYVLDRGGDLLWRETLEDKVWAVDMPADGRWLVVGAGEKEAHVRAFERGGRPLWKRYVEGSVSAVAVSAGAEVVVAGTRRGHIHLFDGQGTPLAHAVASEIIRDVAIAGDGRTAVAASEDGHVYGFVLPPRPRPPAPTAAEPPAGATYHIHVAQATGLAIGDGARVVQSGGRPSGTDGATGDASSDVSKDSAPGRDQRRASLAAAIRETLALIEQYETRRRLADDPKTRRRAAREIADLRAQLAAYEAEYRELNGQ